MKKLFYYLLILPLMASFSSCSDDDDDIPPVDLTVNIEGATRVDNTLYVVQGETFSVASIDMIDNTSKGAVIGSATYYWDYYRVGGTIVKPYGIEISTQDMALGLHLLQIKVSIYAVDYAPCMGYISYNVRVVATADEIPSDGEIEPNPSVKAPVMPSEDINDIQE